MVQLTAVILNINGKSNIVGNITSVSTINTTTGIYGKITTTNNTNKTIPSIGNFGGIGDKLILYNVTSTTYPYSIGIETNSLWISSPNVIKFYNNGFNSLYINTNGNVGVGTTDNCHKLNINGNANIIGEIISSTKIKKIMFI